MMDVRSTFGFRNIWFDTPAQKLPNGPGGTTDHWIVTAVTAFTDSNEA